MPTLRRRTVAAALAVAGVAAAADAVWPFDRPASLSAEELFALVRDRFSRLTDFQAQLTTVTTSSLLGETSSFAGTLFFKKPDLLRIEYTQPFAQTVVFDGAVMYVYLPANKQVIRYAHAGFADVANLPAAFDRLADSYDAELVAETAGPSYELRFLAQDADAVFPEIRMWVDAESLVALRLDLHDNGGGTTSYRLSAYRFDVGLPRRRFTFHVPAGAEVIDAAGAYGP